MANKCVLVDFDGTICEHWFPEIGPPMPEAFEVMKELKGAGYSLILWTCREDESPSRMFLTEAVEFCRLHGVEFDAVNGGVPEKEFRPPTTPNRKPYAEVHIDDRNLGGFPGWGVVRDVVLGGKKVGWHAQED